MLRGPLRKIKERWRRMHVYIHTYMRTDGAQLILPLLYFTCATKTTFVAKCCMDPVLCKAAQHSPLIPAAYWCDDNSSDDDSRVGEAG